MNILIKRSLLILLPALFMSLLCVAQTALPDSMTYVYKLYGQTRKYSVRFSEKNDTLLLDWGIERNMKWQKGRYAMTPVARDNAVLLSYLQPVDGNYVVLSNEELFGIVSYSVHNTLKNEGRCRFDSRTFRLLDSLRHVGTFQLLHAVSVEDETEIWILDNEKLPIIWSVQNNPCGVNWEISSSLPSSDAHSLNMTDETIRKELRQIPLRAGGIYYAYPYGAYGSSVGKPAPGTPAPEGYVPVYISHYGRHGSRYMMDDSDYMKVLKPLEYAALNSGLTPLGQEILRKLNILWSEAAGSAAELTEVGILQHKGIAQRMYDNFTSIFTSGKRVEAQSSTALRCILSMNAFCSQLQRMDSEINMTSTSGNRLMSYISYTSPELKSFSSESMPWQTDAHKFEETILCPERVMSSLFSRKDIRPEDELSYYKALFRMIMSMQNTSLDFSLYHIFTDDELFSLWKSLNYRMYVINAACPLNEGKGPASASHLLNRIIEDADKALNGDEICASLRFGHDTALIRLLTLMQIEGCAYSETDNTRFHLAWQDYRISPMAANLQIIFYKNNKGHIIVRFLHNENETRISSLKAFYKDVYYDWNELKKEFRSRI